MGPIRVAIARTVALFAIVVSITAIAGDWMNEVDGITVYLGVVPAEVARASLSPHIKLVANDVHGRLIASTETHHFVVAIFESATGKRIEDAEVTANLIAIAKHQQAKRLEPMRINDTISYGNAFEVSAGENQRFDVEIRLAGRKRPITVSFNYRDPHGSVQ